MNAESLTKALGGRWHGSYGMACCPAHEDRSPSLSIRVGDGDKMLTHCHAGCSPEAVWDALRDRGLVAEEGVGRILRPPCRRQQNPTFSRRREISDQQHGALEIWRAARLAPGTPVEAYLRHRGIIAQVPPTLRYHPAVRYERSGLCLPCMVAAVQAPDRRVTAIHRTYVRDDGRGKAGVETPKMALGPIDAGAVRLDRAQSALGLAEGVESALSAMQLFDIPVWAALGSRMDRVELPGNVIEVQIFGDNGKPGHEAAEKAAESFTSQGRRVVLRFPPEPFGDWNDALQALCKESG